LPTEHRTESVKRFSGNPMLKKTDQKEPERESSRRQR
jgi:hypothetical protein